MKTQVRGQAAVELAVTMVVLVPIILYTIFLQELLNYKLEGQEPMVAAASDFIMPDYSNKDEKIGEVARLNRLKYCDHSSAFDSYKVGQDCDGAHHYVAAVHQCWLVDGAQQLRCNRSRSDLTSFTGKGVTEFGALPWNKGGVQTCSDAIGVINYFLPEKFMEWQAKPKVNDKVKIIGTSGGTDPHPAGGRGVASSWVLNRNGSTHEEIAVGSDPWALANSGDESPSACGPSLPALGTNCVFIPGMDNVGPDGEKPLLARTAHYFKKYGQDGLQAANDWHGSMNDFLQPMSQTDGVGDHLSSPPVILKKGDKQRSNNGGFGSGYKDARQAGATRNNGYPW
jgi:hypothetical protein